MASKRSASMTLLLALIILLFSLVSACPFCHSSGSNLASSPSAQGSCPMDILKLDVCANLLDLVNVTVGSPQATPCCSHLGGLNETEAATCLCTALRANVLGINLNIPIALSLLLNVCSFNVPSGFQCAN